MTNTDKKLSPTAADPQPSTTPGDPSQESRAFLEDMDRVVAGELPFGVIFGLDSDDIHAFADLADDLLAAGRVAEALFLYTGCVQLDPMDTSLLCGLATTLRHAGDADSARRASELALELEPDNQALREFLTETRRPPLPDRSQFLDCSSRKVVLVHVHVHVLGSGEVEHEHVHEHRPSA